MLELICFMCSAIKALSILVRRKELKAVGIAVAAWCDRLDRNASILRVQKWQQRNCMLLSFEVSGCPLENVLETSCDHPEAQNQAQKLHRIFSWHLFLIASNIVIRKGSTILSS